jgi:hypothetical protein
MQFGIVTTGPVEKKNARTGECGRRLSRTHASRAVPLNRYSSKLMTTSSVVIEEN